MIPPIFGLLSTWPALAPLVGAGNAARVYPFGKAPVEVLRPYVTWMVIGGDAENTMADAPPLDRFVIQIDVWADTITSANTVARAVRDAIETTGYVVAYNPSDDDEATGRYRLSFDAEFHAMR